MENIINMIKNYNLAQDQYSLLLKKLSRYNKGNYIYKSAFIRAGFSEKFIDLLFNDLLEHDYLKENYTIYSPFTLERQRFVTNKKEEIPETYECETTDEEFDTRDQIRIIYKVKKVFNIIFN